MERNNTHSGTDINRARPRRAVAGSSREFRPAEGRRRYPGHDACDDSMARDRSSWLTAAAGLAPGGPSPRTRHEPIRQCHKLDSPTDTHRRVRFANARPRLKKSLRRMVIPGVGNEAATCERADSVLPGDCHRKRRRARPTCLWPCYMSGNWDTQKSSFRAISLTELVSWGEMETTNSLDTVAIAALAALGRFLETGLASRNRPITNRARKADNPTQTRK